MQSQIAALTVIDESIERSDDWGTEQSRGVVESVDGDEDDGDEDREADDSHVEDVLSCDGQCEEEEGKSSEDSEDTNKREGDGEWVEQ